MKINYWLLACLLILMTLTACTTPRRTPSGVVIPVAPEVLPTDTPGSHLVEVTRVIGTAEPTATAVLPQETTWVTYQSDALQLALQHPETWQVAERDGFLYLTSPEQYPLGDSPQQVVYYVYASSIPNPEQKTFAEVVTTDLPAELQQIFSYTQATIGRYAVYRTTSLPSADGALTVSFAAIDRFVSLALTPYRPENPFIEQERYEAIFEQILASVQLLDVEAAAVPNQSSGSSGQPVISADGSIIAFTSRGQLTSNASDELAAYVRNVAAGTTKLINVRYYGYGQPAFDPIYAVALSADGRFVAYYSFDSGIVPDDELDCRGEGYSCEDLFIYDRVEGTTTRLPRGRDAGLGGDYTFAFSSDGRYIAYGDYGQLIRADWTAGTEEPLLTSIDGQPLRGLGFTAAPSFASDGDIAFASTLSNLVIGDTNESTDVFVWDSETATVSRISVASDGTEGDAGSGIHYFHEGFNASLAISANGRFIAFSSFAGNLTADVVQQCTDAFGETRNCSNIYLHDRDTGETILLASDSGSSLALSGDGRFIVFASTANTLVPGTPSCGNPTPRGCGHVYRYDAQTGRFTIISQNAAGELGNGYSYSPDISDDGRYITFASNATNLIPGDTNEVTDIFRFDTATGEMIRVSLTEDS